MVRAVSSPTAVFMLLLVESAAGHRLAAEPVWRNLWVSSLITKAAAGWSWDLDIEILSFMVCVAQPSLLDVLVLVGEVGVRAGLLTINKLLHAQGELLYMIFGVDQHVPHLENGLLKIFRLVCGSSAQAPSCWRERRRQTSWAAAAGG